MPKAFSALIPQPARAVEELSRPGGERSEPTRRVAPKRAGGAATSVLLVLLAVYQRLLSPIFAALGARCRFHPTCSQYAIEAVKHYGAWRGSWRALKRLGRCHPFHPGGFDPPVPSETNHG